MIVNSCIPIRVKMGAENESCIGMNFFDVHVAMF